MTSSSPSAYDQNSIQFAFDGTSLSAFSKCPRYYDWAIRKGWAHKNNTSVHLVFGAAYAKALEEFTLHFQSSQSYIDALSHAVLIALNETWGPEFPDEDGNPGPWESTDPKKNRFNLIRSVIWYLEHFRHDNLPVYIRPNSTPAVELSFRLELNSEILWCGHLDKAVYYGDSKDIYITDQKTTSSAMNASWFESYKLTDQMFGYHWAGQIILETPVKGIIIDGAQIQVGGTNFSRGYITHTPDQLEEWREQTLQKIAMVQWASETENFLPNYAACGNYGGCVFRSICSKPKRLRKNFLKAEFAQRLPWDPLRDTRN